MRFVHVTLEAPASLLPELADFYGGRLGLERSGASFAIGETQLEFVASAWQPFYHFALLVPGNRFDAALDWAGKRTELLPDPETGEVVFDFDNLSALAVYFHDPAANIVELIAHRGVEEREARGEFRGDELVGLSELGLVGDRAGMAEALRRELGLRLWQGTVAEPGSLAFVGDRARTLILAPTGRGWLPLGRPAEPYAIEARLSGGPAGEAELEGGRYRISC